MESTTTAAATITLHAYHRFDLGNDEYVGPAQDFTFQAELPTREDAVAFAAQFPKSCKMSAGTLHCSGGIVRGWASSRGNLVPNKTNHGVNENALRRYQATVKAAAKLGIEIVYKANCKNSYPTHEAFEAAIGINS